MTPEDFRRVQHLLDLADAAVDFKTVSLKLVNYFSAMREDLGLAKLLVLIKEFVEQQARTES